MSRSNRLPARSALAIGALAVISLFASACASEADTKIAVVGTDDSCEPAEDHLHAGDVSFEFTNRAGDVSELYVLRSDGSVVSEVENVTTGTKRTLTVDLAAGSYLLVCKPGQQGDGLSSTLTVTGSGGDQPATADRSIEVDGTEYAFTSSTAGELHQGDVIRFRFVNQGTIQHEMEVFGPDGEPIGEVGPTDAGAEGSVTLEFDEAGTYRFVCGIEGHEAQGMVLSFPVAA